MSTPWTFLTNHTHVLLCITRGPAPTMRVVAEEVGITERAVQRIVADLVAEGYLRRERDGRRNVYAVDADRPLRHPLEQHTRVEDLLELLTATRTAPTRRPDVADRSATSQATGPAVPHAKSSAAR